LMGLWVWATISFPKAHSHPLKPSHPSFIPYSNHHTRVSSPNPTTIPEFHPLFQPSYPSFILYSNFWPTVIFLHHTSIPYSELTAQFWPNSGQEPTPPNLPTSQITLISAKYCCWCSFVVTLVYILVFSGVYTFSWGRL
jgi:hypothetical protein